MQPEQRRSHWLMKLGLLCGSTALTLLLVEIGLRVEWHFRRQAVMANHCSQNGKPALVSSDDPELLYTFRIDSRGTNSRGYPDEEHCLEKDSDVFRIVVIGDSVAAGHNVGWRRSFGRLLEQRLNQRSPRRGFEVITLACTGYSTSQELVLLRNEAFRYHPDLILWCYVLNDPADPVFHNANGDLGILYEPKIHLWHLANQAWFQLKETVRAWGGPSDYHARLHYVYWDLVEQNLGEIGRLCREHHVPVIFMVHPLLESNRKFKEYSFLDLHESLKELAARSGLVPLDLREAYRGYRFDRLCFDDDSWHPNVLGHQLLADFLTRWLNQEGWLLPRDENCPSEGRAMPKE